MGKIALAVLTDGRFDYLCDTIESLRKKVQYPFDYKLIVNDQGDGGVSVPGSSHHVIQKQFPDFMVYSHKERKGLTESVRDLWAVVPSDIKYVFHLEEDFTFNEDIHIEDMVRIMDRRPRLCQLLLKRQPWNAEEISAGGFVEMDPNAYEEHLFIETGPAWIEHRKFFSLNPCLLPKWVVDMGWDDRNETGFTERLFADPEIKSGILGQKFDIPKVHHIGVNRTHSGEYNIPGGLKEK